MSLAKVKMGEKMRAESFVVIGISGMLFIYSIAGAVLLFQYGKVQHLCNGVHAEVISVRTLNLSNTSAIAFPEGIAPEKFPETSILTRC